MPIIWHSYSILKIEMSLDKLVYIAVLLELQTDTKCVQEEDRSPLKVLEVLVQVSATVV